MRLADGMRGVGGAGRRACAAAAAVLLLAASAEPGRSAAIFSPTDAALRGASTIDFDSLEAGRKRRYVFEDEGVVFRAKKGRLAISPATFGGVYGGSGMELSTLFVGPPYRFNIRFRRPVDAFAMSWGAANPDWIVKARDATGKVIAKTIFAGSDGPHAGLVSYYGLAAEGIASVSLRSLGGQDWVKIDDFSFARRQYAPEGATESAVSAPSAVPLPGALPLLIGALGGLALRRRR
ncbi:VPLPA-CTERM sorting domain-containing protein [Oceanicella actignis]|uniref:VPLPA-CTERM sorting domain-containing protein n=1 Tax=Oceanicella actignis TaxID=1189325 RepID=UPI0011E82A42|nr:VPLPA-CTERM sorting domain-containing protein [Oceanicella actignis]TYO88773.1 putative secreted protein with PEP-CTERM sorting signal [Oceanicella actignis]